MCCSCEKAATVYVPSQWWISLPRLAFRRRHKGETSALRINRISRTPLSQREVIMADQAFDKELKNTLQQIEKQFGKGSIMQLGENSTADVPGISSGALSLDIALGGRGLPRGRIIEIFGPESSGKTTVALHAVANAQKHGGVAAFIDAEHALDPSWAKRIGVDLESLLVSQPSNAEEALKIAEMLVKSNAV